MKACHMQRGVAIRALGEELGPEEATCRRPCFYDVSFAQISLLYEVPGGNLVDGLPPAASTGEDDICPAPLP